MNALQIINKIASEHLLTNVVLFDICDHDLTPMAAIEILSSEKYSNSFRYNIEGLNTMVVYKDDVKVNYSMQPCGFPRGYFED